MTPACMIPALVESRVALTTPYLMSIARYARKERLYYGAQKDIATALGVDEAVVSRVMNDKVERLSPATVRRVRAAIARKLRRPISEVFPSLDAA